MIPTPGILPAPSAKGMAMSSARQSTENGGSHAKGQPFGDVLSSQDQHAKSTADGVDKVPEGGKPEWVGGKDLPDPASNGQETASALTMGSEALSEVSPEALPEVSANIASIAVSKSHQAAITQAEDANAIQIEATLEQTSDLPLVDSPEVVDVSPSAIVAASMAASQAIPALQGAIDGKIERGSELHASRSIQQLSDILEKFMSNASGDEGGESTPEETGIQLPRTTGSREAGVIPGLQQALSGGKTTALPVGTADMDMQNPQAGGGRHSDLIPGLQQAITNSHAAVALDANEQFSALEAGLQKAINPTPVSSAFGHSLSPVSDSGSSLGLKSPAGTITTPLGTPGWNSEFLGRVNVVVRSGVQEASLQLSPPDLGRLEIKISTDGDVAKVMFAVDNPTAKEAIEQAMPRLREMLEQGGLQLGQSEVADHSQSQQGKQDVSALIEESQASLPGELDGESESIHSMDISMSNSTVDYYI